MKIPLIWLNDYVDVGDRAPELMAKLTAVGHMQDGPPQTVAGEVVYDLEVRQNRSDVLSLLGVAREAAAVLGEELRTPDVYLTQLPERHGDSQVTITNPDLSYRFNTITIEGLQVGPSPDWLRTRLEAYGIKSVNNLVDITNYVMVELGQPLHAFDLARIDEAHLIVRPAQAGETLTVLGGKNVTLVPDDLVIADPTKVVALAGVMGGLATSVTAETTGIILEAATYNQASVRRSTLRHNLRTEASTRLEKFLHPHLTELALLRASRLILDVCGGEITGHADNYPQPRPEVEITLTKAYLDTISGVELSLLEAQDFLAKIFIPSKVTSPEELVVQVPYFRTDLEQEADIVEEVIRMYGYDNLPSHLPAAPPPRSLQSAAYDLGEQIRDYLVGAGYDEQITEPLTNESEPVREPVRLENSLTSEKVMLRTTLVPMLKKGLEYRRKHRRTDIRIFEVGKVYFVENGQYQEHHTLGLLAAGPGVTYTKFKGVVEGLLTELGYAYDQQLVQITQLETHTFCGELDLEGLIAQPKALTHQVLTSPPQLILQDLSLSVPLEAPVGDLIRDIQSVSPLVYSVELGELPFATGERKNVFLHLAYHDPNQTLRTEDVQPVREQIVELVGQKYGAQLR